MWLLHSRELRLEAFYGSQVPRYVILSHRWENQEVSFQELQTTIAALRPAGSIKLTGSKFSKIEKTRELATSRDNVDWVWIDTCCINKESSAELSEAINSMYRWYENADVCYVYLSDVRWVGKTNLDARLGIETHKISLASFMESAWFSRGWTLQELLAPHQLFFFDRMWECIGERNELAQHVSSVTGIDEIILTGGTLAGGMSGYRAQLINNANVAEKMSWAAKRRTTREEDMAYCLLGLFDVNMPLLYGEGGKAFMRLQLEIIRKSADESIFAWRREAVELLFKGTLKASHLKNWEREQLREFIEQNKYSKTMIKPNHEPKTFHLHSGFLAQQSADFADSGHIKWDRHKKFVKRLPYSMTNQGLQFYVEAFPSRLQWLEKGDRFDLELNCYGTQSVKASDGSQRQVGKPVVLSLVKEGSDSDQSWRRYDCQSFQGPIWTGSEPVEEKVHTAFYIRQDGL